LTFTREDLASLEARSFENLVHFYREELLRIEGGESANRVLSHNHTLNLEKKGVLARSQIVGCFYVLTPHARSKLIEDAKGTPPRE
jgi:hypothetical protein